MYSLVNDEGEPLQFKHADNYFQQFEEIKLWIEDTHPRVIMDIGCGQAILDILIAKHVELESVHLVDGDGSGTKRAGFRSAGKPWRDVGWGVVLFQANCPDTPVTGYRLGVDVIPDLQVDLVISSRSWGHHYPISEHLELVKRCLKPEGHLIIDIRNNTDGLSQLRSVGFSKVARIPDHSVKCTRWLLHNAV